MNAADIAENCRRLVEFLDGLGSEVPVPTHVNPLYGDHPEVQWLLFSNGDLARQKEIAQAVIRGVGGRWRKDPGDLFAFTQRLPSGIELDVTVQRDAVCERIVTGARTITKTIPDPNAPMVEVTEVEETFEWRCEPLLADEGEPEPVNA